MLPRQTLTPLRSPLHAPVVQAGAQRRLFNKVAQLGLVAEEPADKDRPLHQLWSEGLTTAYFTRRSCRLDTIGK